MTINLYKKYLPMLSKIIHPDYFVQNPLAQKSNLAALQTLNAIASETRQILNSKRLTHNLSLFIKNEDGITSLNHTLSNDLPLQFDRAHRLEHSFLDLCQKAGLEIDPSDRRVTLDQKWVTKKKSTSKESTFSDTFRASAGFMDPRVGLAPTCVNENNIYFHSSLTLKQCHQATLALDKHASVLRYPEWSHLPLFIGLEYSNDLPGFLVVPWDFGLEDMMGYLYGGRIKAVEKELESL